MQPTISESSTSSNFTKLLGGRKCVPCQGIPNGRCAPPASPTFKEQNVVDFKTKDIQSSMNATGTLPHVHRGCNRFGTPSHSAFFNRNNPQTQRVQHIKGIYGQPVCCVNDMVLGRQATMCLGRPLTPESNLILYGKIATSAIGTNTSAMPINTITGLQFFPVKQMDTPTLKLLTDAWRAELKELIEKAGLLLPSKGSRGPSPSRSSWLGGNVEEDQENKLELMLVDILCQILEVKSIREVQMWLLTAGQREKDHMANLLSGVMEQYQPQSPNIDTSAIEKEKSQVLAVAIPSTPMDDDDDAQHFSTPSPMISNRPARVNLTDHVTSSVERSLSSPAVCHLQSPQKLVLRYTKRLPTPQPPAAGSLFHEQWSTYSPDI
ncbi:protein TBATA-like [Engraulis encrasicolus]|uniref:protein TBATA-like n=1 Tax=Engraulis encrasicolus TaxID=184585 RepID=UPI002FD21C83